MNVIKNIELPSLYCSLSVRNTKNDSLHIAIFHNRKILYKITKSRLLRFFGPRIISVVAGVPLFIPLVNGYVPIPQPLVQAILDYVGGRLDLDNLYKIIIYYK